MLTKIYADSPDYRLLTELVDEQQDVANITDDTTLVGGQVLDVATDTLPVAVEIDPDGRYSSKSRVLLFKVILLCRAVEI